MSLRPGKVNDAAHAPPRAARRFQPRGRRGSPAEGGVAAAGSPGRWWELTAPTFVSQAQSVDPVSLSWFRVLAPDLALLHAFWPFRPRSPRTQQHLSPCSPHASVASSAPLCPRPGHAKRNSGCDVLSTGGLGAFLSKTRDCLCMCEGSETSKDCVGSSY